MSRKDIAAPGAGAGVGAGESSPPTVMVQSDPDVPHHISHSARSSLDEIRSGRPLTRLFSRLKPGGSSSRDPLSRKSGVSGGRTRSNSMSSSHSWSPGRNLEAPVSPMVRPIPEPKVSGHPSHSVSSSGSLNIPKEPGSSTPGSIFSPGPPTPSTFTSTMSSFGGTGGVSGSAPGSPDAGRDSVGSLNREQRGSFSSTPEFVTSPLSGSVKGSIAGSIPVSISSSIPGSASGSISGSISGDHHRRSYDTALRHAEIPAQALPGAERWFMRVYRADRTFGTVTCSPDISAVSLMQLAARKFFVDEQIVVAGLCHLVLATGNTVRRLAPHSKPVLVVSAMLERAGYTSRDFRMPEVCREDITFLCRIYLIVENPNGVVRPVDLAWRIDPQHLRFTNIDLVRFPPAVSPGRVETLDVSWSAMGPLSARRMPYLRVLRAQGVCMTALGSGNLEWVAAFSQVQLLDLSCNALTELPIDFAPFHNLTTLELRGNSLTTLPESLKFVNTLQYLGLGSNALTNSADCWAPYLREIDLSFNAVSSLAGISRSPLLAKLVACGNHLESLPEDECVLLEELRYVDLRFNPLLSPPVAIFPAATHLDASFPHPEGHGQMLTSTRDSPGHFMRGMRSLKWKMPTAVLPQSLTTITILDQSRAALQSLDDGVFAQMPMLRTLELGYNSLTRLTPSMNHLPRLRVLSIWGNSLVALSPGLVKLQSLEVLDVHANNLKTLPPQIWMLPRLRVLNVSSNLVEVLPPVGRNRQLALEELHAADNRLDDGFIDDLNALAHLKVLNLSHNALAEIPPGLFSRLTQLEELYVSGNRLSTLPHEDLEAATNLKVLLANSNRLHTLPAELAKASQLEVLDVSANALRYNVANWPFDWNWRWNTRLHYLNLSANRRLEIRRPPGWARGEIDLSDFTILPRLATLGLTDVTLTTSGVPEQTENCRVRTYGGELTGCQVGVADCLGPPEQSLGLNDLVVDRFRGEDEVLIGLFDGHPANMAGGNRISHLAQTNFTQILKRELARPGTVGNGTGGDDIQGALRRAFLAVHREIGNTALLTPEEMAHSFLGHHSSAATHLRAEDRSTASGATVLYLRNGCLYVASLGGAKVVLSFGTGEHRLLAEPPLLTRKELQRIREGGGWIDPATGLLMGLPGAPYTRLIGGYDAAIVLSAEPAVITEYPFGKDPHDVVVLASAELWDYVSVETAADVVRGAHLDPTLAALKLRDLAIGYGLRSRVMIVVVAPPAPESPPNGAGPLSSLIGMADHDPSKQRRHTLDPSDARLARLGNEVAPPIGEVTMVFTDIRRSTMLWETVPAVMRAAIATHNSVMRRTMRLMEGYEVKTEGDAFIVSFHTPARALAWCLTVQQQLLRTDWPPELLQVPECGPVYDRHNNLLFRGLSVRMGVHCGRPVAEPDPITLRMDYFGPMVNRAARISGIAQGGQIAVSADVLTAINKLRESNPAAMAPLKGIPYAVDEIGELKLRGIENPEHIHIVYPVSLADRRNWYTEEEEDVVAETVHAAEEAVSRTTGLHSLCHRLEAQCAILSGGDASRIAQSDERGNPEIWVTRIENAIARLRELLQNPA